MEVNCELYIPYFEIIDCDSVLSRWEVWKVFAAARFATSERSPPWTRTAHVPVATYNQNKRSDFEFCGSWLPRYFSCNARALRPQTHISLVFESIHRFQLHPCTQLLQEFEASTAQHELNFEWHHQQYTWQESLKQSHHREAYASAQLIWRY